MSKVTVVLVVVVVVVVVFFLGDDVSQSYGGPKLSRQKEKAHGKKKNLTAKAVKMSSRYQRKRGGWGELSRCTMG